MAWLLEGQLQIGYVEDSLIHNMAGNVFKNLQRELEKLSRLTEVSCR